MMILFKQGVLHVEIVSRDGISSGLLLMLLHLSGKLHVDPNADTHMGIRIGGNKSML